MTTNRYPLPSIPNSRARSLAVVRRMAPRWASSSARAATEETCLRGMMRTWVGAWGCRSLKATTSGVERRIWAGASPAAMRQNTQDLDTRDLSERR